MCEAAGIEMCGLVLEEGNIDADDCFVTRQRLDESPLEDNPADFANYHSAKWLVDISDRDILLQKVSVLVEKGHNVLFILGRYKNIHWYIILYTPGFRLSEIEGPVFL